MDMEVSFSALAIISDDYNVRHGGREGSRFRVTRVADVCIVRSITILVECRFTSFLFHSASTTLQSLCLSPHPRLTPKFVPMFMPMPTLPHALTAHGSCTLGKVR